MKPIHLVWHRCELRTHDQPALYTARQRAKDSGGSVIPLVIIDSNIFKRSDLTDRRKAWFLENVKALRATYRELGADLLVRDGKPEEVFRELLKEFEGANLCPASLHFIKNYTPYATERDQAVTQLLEKAGAEVVACPGQYTCEPGSVLTEAGKRYGVYSPYRRKWDATEKAETLGKPRQLGSVPEKLKRGDIPKVDPGIELPEPGEEAALRALRTFIKNWEQGYEESRNQPGQNHSTSRLSMYFTLGALSPRLATQHAGTQKWKAELAWRDFLTDVLDRNPEGTTQEFDERWRKFPWRQGETNLERWQKGLTGYPWVDAGMRELNQTGYMHNRVRMTCASFLTKHLLIDWRLGEEYFRAQLLDGDRAQNVGNWQWCAGCGIDPAPYFRVFNPVTQGEKFDPKGDYIRTWIPELADLPDKVIHKPWEAGLLKVDYPEPMIRLEEGRDRFLEVAKEYLKKGYGGEG